MAQPSQTAFDRLPAWARTELQTLRHRVAQLEAAAEAFDTNDLLDTGVYVSDVVAHQLRPLGQRAVIHFQVADPAVDPNYGYGTIEAMITERQGEPRLQVRTPHGALFIRPDSANTIHIAAPGTW